MTTNPILIFDLGDVLYSILSDRQWLDEQLHPLLGEALSWESLASTFDAFEVGDLSENQLYEALGARASRSFSLEELEAAWNRRLVEMKEETVEMLLALKQTHRIFLLSNTNQMHKRFFTAAVEEKFSRPLFDEVFEHCFYSCDMGLKKPDKRIYSEVVNHIGESDRGRYYFFDDNAANVEAASAFGWKAEHVREPITAIIARRGLL